MNEQVTDTTDLDPWDDEIFADFVASEDEGVEPDEPIQKVDALKSALAKLSTDPMSPSTGDSPPAAPRKPKPSPVTRPQSGPAKAKPRQTSGQASPAGAESIVAGPCEDPVIRPAELGQIECEELAEAFLDDAARGTAALDQAVIDYESDNNRAEALGQICRELHTLKGASSTVGLTDTGRYIHEIEDFVQKPGATPAQITEVLLGCLDTLRRQSALLAGNSVSEESETTEDAPTETTNRIEAASEGEDSISVKGEQLDRLLDMLTSLTMLDNQRDTRVDRFREIDANLRVCGNRIRDLERSLLKGTSLGDPVATLKSAGSPLREVANDLGEIGRLLRDAYSPITQEHVAVSNFIRQFRHALVSIMRMPVTGMFRRLQRAALDAARIERKQVRLDVIGSDAGLERSVQERLLDPLMHIIRNAVSHGIESPEERRRLGKDPVGTVTLEAISAPNLLTLNVKDDGRGLDYESLRRKGTELGLLQDGRNASREELGKLIFRRGLSTRSTANEVAGRGVGMDVVADTLEKLHSWIEVDSTPNEGTNIRLTVPLKSITEHALVVRAGEHLVALPMQFVRSADDSEVAEDASIPNLAHALGIPHATTRSSANVIAIERVPNPVKSSDESHTISFVVDEVIGPQEVVVRPLPALMRHQKLFGGVTLAADGQLVFVLNALRLAGTLQAIVDGETAVPRINTNAVDDSCEAHVLIVDDSLSARNAASMMFGEKGLVVHEAQDGMEGLEMLEEEDWAVVITDFDMPKMNGIKFVEALRAQPNMQNVPVLMVSSRSPEEMETVALEAGATHYVTKPLTAEVFDKLIQPTIENAGGTNG